MSTPARGPLAVSRHAQILDALAHHGTVRISDLTSLLDVTAVTVRRDITQLAAEGLLVKVHGGAAALARTEDGDELVVAPATGDGGGRSTPSAERSIGMLVPALDYYWPDIVRSARQVARQLGVRVVLRGSSYDTDDDRTQLERLLDSGDLHGLIAAPNLSAPHARETIDWLASAPVPVVLVEREASAPPHDMPLESVVSDHAGGAAAAVRHLVDAGHRRIGLVVSTESPTSRHVRRGWLQASSDAGLPAHDVVDASLPTGGALDVDPAFEQVVDQLLETRTTALLVHADSEAIGVAQHLQQRGLVIPDDVSLISYDDTVVGLFSPALTAVHPSRTSVGAMAMQLLAARLDDPTRPVHRVLVSPTLNMRESVVAPRARLEPDPH
jgi:DNA-binding LacI/PurR family transcriptional regulator